MGKDNKQILSELDKAMIQMRQLPLSEQILVAWYCLRGMDRRFEGAEADFIRRLDGMGLPVILVLTQVPMRAGYFLPDAVLLAEQILPRRLPIVGGRPFMRMPRRTSLPGRCPTGSENFSMPPFALRPKASRELSSRRKRSIMRGSAGSEQVHNRCCRQRSGRRRHAHPLLRRCPAGAYPTWHDGPDRPDLQDQI